MSYFYKIEEVKHILGDNWLAVLYGLAPELSKALEAPGRHASCPVHGTAKRKGDGFRLFKDAHRTGGGICNTCGPRPDGFGLLMWLKGWSFQDCLLAVGDFVNAPKHLTKKGRAEQVQPKPTFKKTYKKQSVQRTQVNEPTPGQTQEKARGTLVDFGSAPYRNDPSKSESYFVVIQHSTGYKQVIWGADLSRAIEAAKAKKGNEITLLSLGKKHVTIKQEIVSDQGVVGEQEISAHRNEWEIVNHSQASNDEFESLIVVESTPIEDDVSDISFNSEVTVLQHNEQEKSGIDTTPDWVKKVQDRMAESEKRRAAYNSQLSTKHQQLWNECFPITSERAYPVWAYLNSRQITVRKKMLIEGDCFRFHPALPFYNKDRKLEGNFPAIIAAIRDVDGNLITLHRIYLTEGTEETKPFVAKAKKIMPIPEGLDVNGGAIRLGDPTKEGYLGIAEGVETALSAFRATGIPTWSTVNATLMKSVEIPEGVHTVLIWADLDNSLTGELAANYLKNTLEEKGLKVGVLLPAYPIPNGEKSLDWNDVLVEQGILGFPSASHIKRFFDKANRYSKVERSNDLQRL